jgi:Zn-dependent protease
MIRFSFFGIPVEIQPWFWVILALIGSNFGRMDEGSNQALLIALFVIAGGFSIFVHELGHALTGKMFRARPFIVLHGFGGYAAFPGSYFSQWQSFLVTAAGPAIQLMLGGLALFANYMMPELSDMFRIFLTDLALVSIFWALLNLLPVIPLDGGQMMAALLGPQRRKLSLQVSMIAAVVCVALMWKFGIGTLMPFYLLYFAWLNYQEMKDTGY